MKKDNKGFIQAVVVIVIALLVLNYLHIDVGGFISTLSNFVMNIWRNYLQEPAIQIWQMIGKVIKIS